MRRLQSIQDMWDKERKPDPLKRTDIDWGQEIRKLRKYHAMLREFEISIRRSQWER